MVGGMRGCCGRCEVCGRGRGVCWEGWRGGERGVGGVEECGGRGEG